MTTRTLILTALAASLLATGCAKKEAEAPAIDLAAEEQAIRDRSMEWLKFATAKDAAGIANSILAANSVTMYDGVINEGAAAVQAATEEGYTARPNSTTTWTTDEVHVAASGDLAYELGTATEDADGDGEAAPTTGRYVTVWSKVDGTWRAVADAGTQLKPAEAAAPAGG